MLTSLITLSRFVKFKKVTSGLKVEFLFVKGERLLKLPVNHTFIDEFEVSKLLNLLSILMKFIEVKSNIDMNLIVDATCDMDKISHFLKRTLDNVSTGKT